MPPSPTAAAHRLTEPERTSPAAKTPGRLVSSGPGGRLIFCQADDWATAAPVRMKPFASCSISCGSQLVHGDAPIIEKVLAFRLSVVHQYACSRARLIPISFVHSFV